MGPLATIHPFLLLSPDLSDWNIAIMTTEHILIALGLGLLLLRLARTNPSSLPSPPPMLNKTTTELTGSEAPKLLREALAKSEGVITMKRCGRTEYLVDGPRHGARVLLDHRAFEFEDAILNLLNLGFVRSFGSPKESISELQLLIEDSMKDIDPILRRVTPMIAKHISAAQGSSSQAKIANTYPLLHASIAEAMVPVAFGEDYAGNKAVIRALDRTAEAIANLSGVNRATQWLPRYIPAIWPVCTVLREFLGVLLPHFYIGLLGRLWRNRERHLNDHGQYSSDGFVPLFSRLLQRHAAQHPNGKTSIRWTTFISICTTILLGMTFGSIHQSAVTATWVLFYLAQRPEWRTTLREELEAVLPEDRNAWTHHHLNSAVLTDAVIREVMRIKGDTFSTPRTVIADPGVQLGPYHLPKGANVHVVLFTSHEDPKAYPEPFRFRPERHIEAGTPTSMGTSSFLPFGLGRWACPGRILAVDEIKLIVANFLLGNDFHLEGDEYTITDPTTTTAVPPSGILCTNKLT